MSFGSSIVVMFLGLEKAVGTDISGKPYLTNGVTATLGRTPALALLTRTVNEKQYCELQRFMSHGWIAAIGATIKD